MTTQPATCQSTAIEVYSQSDADGLLASPDFQAQWRSLARDCPWSTALQSPEFACTWYRIYSGRYTPLILARHDGGSRLNGLLLLAVERTTGRLTFAGSHQSEYNVWLALPGDTTFIAEALRRLSELGFPAITFTYLPPATPLDWLDGEWKERATLRAVRRPLLTVSTPDAITESITKKKNRRRMEKLQAGQSLEFFELQTPEQLDEYYDEIINYCDLRQGAAHGSCPFRDDPQKRVFNRALMTHPGLLHVTVFKSGNRLLAAHIGVRNKQEVMLGIVAHSPFLAEHSPGKLHVLQLGLMLHEQGFSALDLTPGGDAYKDDRATSYDEAHVLTVFLSDKALRSHRVSAAGRSAAKSIARILHLDREHMARLRSIAKKALSHPFRAVRSLFRLLGRRLWSSTEMRLYRARAEDIDKLAPTNFQRDSIRDLLCYEAGAEGRPRQSFLSDVMARLASGIHPYSMVRDNILVHYGWLTERSKQSFMTEVQHPYQYPPNSAVMWDFYTHPAYRGQGLYSQSLRRIMSDAAGIPGTEFVYIAVLADNRASRRVIEKSGFTYHESIFRTVRFGKANYRIGNNTTQD